MSRYTDNPFIVAQAPADQRAAFIRSTYLNLAGAIFFFIALEAVFLGSSWAPSVVRTMTGGQYS